MEVLTTETVPNKEIEATLGIARGNTVEARNVGRDITQSIRNLAGGELKAYSELLTNARDEALQRILVNTGTAGQRSSDSGGSHEYPSSRPHRTLSSHL